MDLRQFLESTAPNEVVEISGLHSIKQLDNRPPTAWLDEVGEIECFCDICDDVLPFDCRSKDYDRTMVVREDRWYLMDLNYSCRLCRQQTKVFSFQLRCLGEAEFEGVKLGEWPPFGRRLPARLVTLLRPERALLFKAKTALNAGLGIGAFAYYRRVVESQKVALFDEIIRTGRAIGIEEDKLAGLEAARDEGQFNRSLKLAGDAIPERLLVAGENPLSLLHSALSEGLHSDRGSEHAEDDERCLELAASIEQILVKLAKEMHHLRREKDAIHDAVKTLRNRGNESEPT